MTFAMTAFWGGLFVEGHSGDWGRDARVLDYFWPDGELF